MYQLAGEACPIDRTRVFIDTCTSMVPSSDTMKLVRSATSLMRAAFRSTDLTPLRDFVARVEKGCDDLDDVFAAAGQAVIDELDDVAPHMLHDAIRRVAQIERDVLGAAGSDRWDSPRAAYAG